VAFDASICVGSDDTIHIAFCEGASSFDIKYRNVINGIFGSIVNITSFDGTYPGYEQNYPSVGVDSLNNIHIAWQGSSPDFLTHVKYIKNTGGVWGAITEITLIDDGGIALVVDSADNIHIAWGFSNTLSTALSYIKITGGVFGSIEQVQAFDGNSYYRPCLCLDSNDIPHVVYCGGAGSSGQINYQNRIGGAWGNFATFGAPAGASTVVTMSMDSHDNIFVFFNQLFTGVANIAMYKYDHSLATWQAVVKLTTFASGILNGLGPIAMFSKMPIVAGIKTNVMTEGYVFSLFRSGPTNIAFISSVDGSIPGSGPDAVFPSQGATNQLNSYIQDC
jgi:hypothetical protein